MWLFFSRPAGLLALCEVALGTQREMVSADCNAPDRLVSKITRVFSVFGEFFVGKYYIFCFAAIKYVHFSKLFLSINIYI